MKRPYLLGLLSTATALLALAGPVHADSVGMISDVDGGGRVISDGSARTARVGASVNGGDQITADSGGRVVVDLASGSVTVTESNSPYRVAGESKALSSGLSRFFARITNLFGTESSPGPTNLISRGPGDPPDVPILELTADTVRQQVVAGKRRLALEWISTNKPFKVTVKQGGAVLADLTVEEAKARTEEIDLKPGVLEIAITDGKGLFTSRKCDVVEAAPTPPGVTKEELSSRFVQLLAIGWLAGQERGAWTFEAYQQLSAIAADYKPAAELATRLAKGGDLLQ
jgi:hypothetical protein